MCPTKLRRTRVLGKLLAVSLILAAAFLFTAPISPVHAAGPSLVQHTEICNGYSQATCTGSPASSLTLANAYVVDFDFTSSTTSCISVSSVVGTLLGTYTQGVVDNYVSASNCFTSAIYYHAVTSGGSETVTVTLARSSGGNFEVAGYEVSGVSTTIHTASGTVACNSEALGSTSFAAGAFLLSTLGSGCGGSLTPGSSFSAGSLGSPIFDEYSLTVSSPTTFPMSTTGTSGSSSYAGIAFDPVVNVTQPVTCPVAEVGASQPTLAASVPNGDTVSPTTVLCDGNPHSLTVNASAIITLTVPTDGATSRDRLGSGYTTTATVTACSSGTCTGASITVHVQELLTLSNCNGPSVAPSSPTSDNWFNYGTTLTTANCNGVWSRSGGTGTRAISYNWNGGSNTAVSTTAAFNAAPVTMNAGETLNVNPATQYFVTLDSSATSALSGCHPTIVGDACWYDATTTANIDLLGAYGRSTTTGTGHRLTSWELDSGSTNTLLTSSTFTISVGAIAAPHTIHTTSAVQYFVTPGVGLTLSAATISAGDTGWYDANAAVTAQGAYPVVYVVSSPLWINQFSAVGLQLTTNGTVSTVTYGSLVLTFNCAKCAVQLFVPSSSGLNVQTVTDDGKNVRFSALGSGIVSFSGSSAWTVYFGSTVVQVVTSSGATTTETSSTSAAPSGGLWANLNSDPTWLETIAIAAALVVLTILVLRHRGHSFSKDLQKLEHIGGKD